jgi:hypothetical protein
MALQREKTLSNGFTGNYWRIVRISTLAKDGSEVFLGLFKDKATSDELGDVAVIDMQTFNFDIPKDCFIEGNVYEWVYNKIKESKIEVDEEGNEIESNWFVDAKDC